MRVFLSFLVLVAAAGAGIAYVQEAQPAWYERLRYPLSYDHIVVGHAANYDLDPALLAAVIYRESKFDARARSSSGAIGLMQLLPDTAKGIAVHTGARASGWSTSTTPRSTCATAPSTCVAC
jgi:soluble lytic murein transglycosylase